MILRDGRLRPRPAADPRGWQLLESLPPYDPNQTLALSESLRREGRSPALVSAALTQQRLRQRATAKFGPFADRMLFTPDGLEQATRLAVSAHHAARYARAGSRLVADLGCGIGGDALALASLCPRVLAVERDEATAALATINLTPFPNAEVRCADALALDLAAAGVDAVFADPARRAGGRRLTDPEHWSPPLSSVLALREQVAALGVKVAPGIDHALLPADAHAQWVSVDGEVVEAGIWCGPLAPEGPGRSALVLRTRPDGGPPAQVLTDPDCSDPAVPPVQLDPVAGPETLGSFIHEPDGAAIRAGLVAHLAGRLDARPVGHRIAYLTGSRPAGPELAPFVRSWRLVEVLPLHLKALRSRLRSRGIGRLEIHARGVDLSPDALRASLRPRGDAGETWLLTRIGARGEHGRSPRGAVLVVEPIEAEMAAPGPAPAGSALPSRPRSHVRTVQHLKHPQNASREGAP
ncbi:class I SAM-dependent methyltransferase [Actinomyces ruminis]|uniref:Methyltransferase domain-containing protein n=1 Tax=Actinomyces ruminis TaxID=1937003 RepID=A0ABX4MBW2_9ACTO|nr:class I SAM-dependent methyltransferase [Actinomyces ruminis]PHP52736.1 methyltransferase domain-containing protein [Actinomyces ruminis]